MCGLEEARVRAVVENRAGMLRMPDRLPDDRGAAAGCELHDLSISVSAEAACGDGVLRIRQPKTGGGQVDVWMPVTFHLRKVDGTWRVTQERTPMPMHSRCAPDALLDRSH
jgi:ketosteroid isomerase-like protein